MPYKVLFAGLACFHATSANDVMALLPDGRHSSPQHLASIVVRTRDVLPLTLWPGAFTRYDATVFPITQPATLRLPSSGTAVVRTEHLLPYLQDVDPTFEIDRTQAKTIVCMQIWGTLTSLFAPRIEAIYSELVTEWDDDINITSHLGTIALASRTEIAIANVSNDPSNEINHFRIYEELARVPANLSRGPRPMDDRPQSTSIHPIFHPDLIAKITLYCSNTGCC